LIKKKHADSLLICYNSKVSYRETEDRTVRKGLC
jgi:hypothetical protein